MEDIQFYKYWILTKFNRFNKITRKIITSVFFPSKSFYNSASESINRKKRKKNTDIEINNSVNFEKNHVDLTLNLKTLDVLINK